MNNQINRRDFLKLAGIGGVVFASGLGSLAHGAGKGAQQKDFYFVQLSDTHWGFSGPSANPDAAIRITVSSVFSECASVTNPVARTAPAIT